MKKEEVRESAHFNAKDYDEIFMNTEAKPGVHNSVVDDMDELSYAQPSAFDETKRNMLINNMDDVEEKMNFSFEGIDSSMTVEPKWPTGNTSFTKGDHAFERNDSFGNVTEELKTPEEDSVLMKYGI